VARPGVTGGAKPAGALNLDAPGGSSSASTRTSSIGAKYGIWLAIVAGIVEVGAAVAELGASGKPLPWQQPQQV
jgi:hypothetical protein